MFSSRTGDFPERNFVFIVVGYWKRQLLKAEAVVTVDKMIKFIDGQGVFKDIFLWIENTFTELIIFSVHTKDLVKMGSYVIVMWMPDFY